MFVHQIHHYILLAVFASVRSYRHIHLACLKLPCVDFVAYYFFFYVICLVLVGGSTYILLSIVVVTFDAVDSLSVVVLHICPREHCLHSIVQRRTLREEF